MIFVGILFRFINVGILAILFSYVFKNYVYPVISAQIIQYLAYMRGLKDSISLARQQQASLDADYIQQKKEAQRLLENVKTWSAVIAQEKDKNDYDVAMRFRAISLARQQQEANYAQSLINRTLIPEAFERSTLVLTREYEQDKKRATGVINDIVKVLSN